MTPLAQVSPRQRQGRFSVGRLEGCKLNTVEKRVLKIVLRALAKEHVRYETSCFYDWLVSPKGFPMQLDIYLPAHGIAIEIDGCQHYRFPNQWHKNYGEYLDQKVRDQAKGKCLKDKGIELVRIRGERLRRLSNLKYLPKNHDMLVCLPAFNKGETRKQNKYTLESWLRYASRYKVKEISPVYNSGSTKKAKRATGLKRRKREPLISPAGSYEERMIREYAK